MITLATDPLWNQPCLAYHVQAEPDAALVKKLGEAQRALDASFPLPLHLIPPAALHCSVMTLIPPHRDDPHKQADWRRIRAAMAGDLDLLLREAMTQPIPITLRHLRISPQAIIAWTPEQPPLFAGLRARLSAMLDDLGLPAPHYALTHVTVARYAMDGSVPRETIAAIEAQSLALSAAFSSLRLVRERHYPSLVLDRL